LPPKELRHFLNEALQRERIRTFRFRQLSRAIRPAEVPSEMRGVLKRISNLSQR
jgi:hypothetical protein